MTERDPVVRDAHLDLVELRAEVEARTILPEFAEVARRARKRRVRGRLTTFASVLALLAILAPAGILADWHRQHTTQGLVSGPDVTVPVTPGRATGTPGPSPSPSVQVAVLTAAGVDLAHLYALVDVCVSGSCDLQLSRVTPGQGTSAARPLRTNLLRTNAVAWLGGAQLAALSANSLLVSGVPSNGRRQYQRVDLVSVDGSSNAPAVSAATTADRAVQLSQWGAVQAVRVQSGSLVQLPSQPPLVNPVVVAGIAPAKGIWVTGTAPGTGELAVAVSRDAGRSWTTRPLGVPAGASASADPPVVASYTGSTAYLLIRLADGVFALFWTTDGGQSWHMRAGQPPWPQRVPLGSAYGLVVRPDGSLLAWLAGDTVSHLQSSNRGATFRAVAGGPAGPVYPVPDGYVALGTTPQLSHDGVSWSAAQVAYEVPGG